MSEAEAAGPGSAPSGFEELARTALLEVTDARSIGPLVSETDEGDGVVSLRFESNLPGYLGWKWTVSVAKIGDAEPTVLETELMPGDGALLAPEWVPWSERLDEYNAVRAAAEAGEDEDDTDDDLGDDEDLIDEEDLVDDDLGDDLGVDEYDGMEEDVDVDAKPVLAEDENADLLDAEDSDDERVFEDVLDGGAVSGSDAASVGVDEAEQAQGDAGDAGPDQPGIVGPDETAEAEQQADERE
jgi:hypothetical protein